MPSKVIYERFWWFHNQVKAGKYPNAGKLAQRFELSVKTAQRDILSLHLLQYMGNRHIIAHCSLRDELRDFALSRIQSVKPSLRNINPDISSGFVKEYMRKNFGLLSSETSIEVCLKFSPDIAPWVSEQVWYSEQKQTKHSDGSLCLTFPVADLKEIKREVLKYGSQVKVLFPQQLRDEVKKEIEKMKKIYREDIIWGERVGYKKIQKGDGKK